jgi:hypothetical protein
MSMTTTEELNAANRRLIPVPSGMCPAFYEFMGAGCARSDSGEILMLADSCGERDRTKTEELSAAVASLRADNYGLSRHDAADKEADQALLANAYLAHIAEQERVAGMRAIPITEEWLVSTGFKAVESHIGPNYGDDLQCGKMALWEFNDTGEWLLREADSFGFRTRGEVFDLLAALKIEKKRA